jgi:predicted RNA-binding protein with PUA-like domain
MNYWLMKSEPDAFSIDDLQNRPNQTEPWDGIRNYTARNFMRDEMEVGDLAIFYHSNDKPPHAIGIMEIVSEPYPDHTAFDPNCKYFDKKSDPDNPRWVMVDVKFVSKFPQMVPLADIKANPKLKELQMITHNRLSITKVKPAEWKEILKMAGVKA